MQPLKAALTDTQPLPETPPLCPDFLFLIDDKPVGDVTPVGRSFTVTVGLGPNVMLQSVYTKTDRPVVQDAISKAFTNIPRERSPMCVNFTQQFQIANMIAGGEFPLKLVFVLSDADLQTRKVVVDTRIVLPGKGGGWLSEDILTLLNARKQGPPKRLIRDVTPDDLGPADLERLGISLDDYHKCIALLREGAKEAAAQYCGRIKQVRQMRKNTTAEDEGGLADKIRRRIDLALNGSKTLDTEVDTRVFEISHGNNSIKKTRVTINIPARFTLSQGGVVLYIPKELAQSADAIIFTDLPDEILENDPVVKWAFSNVPQDQYREYGFTVDGDAQNFDVVAKAAADEPSLLTRLILWIVGMFSGGSAGAGG
jgi:hypothetical protein